MSNRNHFTYASIAPAVVPAMREWTGFSFLVFILWELEVRTKGGKPVTIKNGIHRTSVRFLLDTVLGEHAWPLRLPRQCPGIDNFLINQAPCRRPRSWKVSQAWIQLKAVSTCFDEQVRTSKVPEVESYKLRHWLARILYNIKQFGIFQSSRSIFITENTGFMH